MRLLAYNTRFLILPWVRVEHLASHILGRMAARDPRRLATDVRASDLFAGNVRRSGALSRDVLSRGQLGGAGPDDRARQAIQQLCAEPSIKEVLGYPLLRSFASYWAVMKKKTRAAVWT